VQVSAFAYRTPFVVDEYSFLRRGLGDNFSDYDRLSVSVNVYPPLHSLRLTPTFEILRQGEGDLRIAPPPTFVSEPTLFIGQRETTFRLALQGRYQWQRLVWLTWDLGQNFVRNSDHTTGRNVSTFSAAAALGLRLEIPRRR
jgi:hypothetical protein